MSNRWRFSILLLPAFFPLCSISAQTTGLEISRVSKTVLEERLSMVSDKDVAREATLKAMFERAGCRAPDLVEQVFDRKGTSNLICTLRGGPSTIIVGAHLDHVIEGRGIVDDWSGAALLPILFQDIGQRPRKHTFIFTEFNKEEKGLLGSRYYVGHMTSEQVARIRAMVNLDSLGLGPTKIWLSHSDASLAGYFNGLAAALHLSLEPVNADNIGDEDSSSFRGRKVPTLMVHSITQDSLGVLHTSRDNFSAIKLDDYYDTYRLLSAYLVLLDARLD